MKKRLAYRVSVLIQLKSLITAWWQPSQVSQGSSSPHVLVQHPLPWGGGLELRVITAAIIGGASLSGGEGSVLGAFLGALFMGVLANSLNLLGVDVYWQRLITGLILIIAVVFDVVNERRKEREK